MKSPSEFFDQSKHLSDEGVSLVVDALELDVIDRLPKPVMEHISRCERCKGEIMSLEAIVEHQKYGDIRSHPYFGQVSTVHTRRRFVVYRIAASVAIVVGLGFLAYVLGLFSSHAPEQVKTVAQQTTDIARPSQPSLTPEHSAPGGSIAANFVESPNLENIVGSNTRASDVRIVSPVIGARVRGDVVFKWEGDTPGSLTLKILDNREAVVKKARVQESQYILREKLQEGLYYWKLEGEGELLAVGKFVIREKTN
jgi:hypothetical protein